jgi:hypothetical protein
MIHIATTATCNIRHVQLIPTDRAINHVFRGHLLLCVCKKGHGVGVILFG